MYKFTDLQIQALFKTAIFYEKKLVALSLNREDLDREHLALLRRFQTIVKEYDDILYLLDIEDDYIEFKKNWGCEDGKHIKRKDSMDLSKSIILGKKIDDISK